MHPREQTRSTNGWRLMRVRLKGINSVRKRLADGTLKTFWYAWKSGPPLRGEPGSPEFIASYNAAVATKVWPQRASCSPSCRDTKPVTLSAVGRLERATTT